VTAAARLQALSNATWVCARLGLNPSELLDAIAVESASRLETFSTQGVALLAWAFAKLGHRPPAAFLRAAEAHMKDNFGEYSSQGIALVLFGLAMQGYRSQSLLKAVSREIEACGLQFSPHDLATVMCAFAMMEHRASKTIQVVQQQCVDCLGDFEAQPQLLCSIMWATAQLRMSTSKCAPSLQHLSHSPWPYCARMPCSAVSLTAARPHQA
jgi:hypothetical protein